MKSSDVFPSTYLKAADIAGHEPVVTISKVEMTDLGDDRKPVAYFAGKDKGLVLNKTNFAAIEEITGEADTDDWTGHKIKLFVAKVEYQGKRVPAIRVDAPDVAPKPKPTPEPVDAPDDDEIPF